MTILKDQRDAESTTAFRWLCQFVLHFRPAHEKESYFFIFLKNDKLQSEKGIPSSEKHSLLNHLLFDYCVYGYIEFTTPTAQNSFHLWYTTRLF